MAEIRTTTAIIGAGQAGVPLARTLAEAGQSVALVESTHLGGSCVNFGCTPSKAMIASARLAAQARRGAEYGLRIPSVETDFRAVMDRARRMATESRQSLEESFAGKENPRLVTAHARFAGREGGVFRLEAGADTLLAERVVLDTGTRSAMPELPGLEAVEPITGENWIDLTELPRSVLFLGGGTIALEVAQCYRRFGAAVTVVQQGRQLTEREDPDVADCLREALAAEGIAIHLGAEAERVERTANGVRLHLKAGQALEAERLFVATGRQGNTDDLGLDTIGLAPGKRGTLEVDEHLRTKVEGVFAAGDLRGGPQFTHTAYDDYRVLRSLFLRDGSRTTQRVIPYAVFTQPELGRVGMSESEAREAGRDVRVGVQTMTDSGKAKELGFTRGFIKVVTDAGTGEILGAAALCEAGAEVVQVFTALTNAGATKDAMLEAIAIHPTIGEAAKNAVVSICED